MFDRVVIALYDATSISASADASMGAQAGPLWAYYSSNPAYKYENQKYKLAFCKTCHVPKAVETFLDDLPEAVQRKELDMSWASKTHEEIFQQGMSVYPFDTHIY